MGNKRTEDVILFQSNAAHLSHFGLILPHEYNYTQYKCWWSMKSNWTSTHIRLKLSVCTRTQRTHSGYMDDINEDRQQTLVNEVNKGSDILDHWGEGRQPWKLPDKWSHAPCNHFHFASTFSDQCSTMNRGQLELHFRSTLFVKAKMLAKRNVKKYELEWQSEECIPPPRPNSPL